ncbi:hypothetical protein Tco_1168158 [Tanacetum coccineum]
MAIFEVQQATQEAEEALSQGLDSLNQSLYNTITSDALSSPTNMANYIHGSNGCCHEQALCSQKTLYEMPDFNKVHEATRSLAVSAFSQVKGSCRILNKVMWRPDKKKLLSIIVVIQLSPYEPDHVELDCLNCT